MIKSNINRTIVYLLLLTLFSCSQRPKVEVFLVGEGVLQYFARPSGMSAKDADMQIDFTLRPKAKDWPVFVNFSIIQDEYKKINIDKVFFRTENSDYLAVDSVALLYKKVDKSMTRYTSIMTIESFKKITDAKDVSMILTHDNDSLVFTGDSDFYKRMKLIALEINE